MRDEWFSDPNSTGTLTVASDDDGWYVADSVVDGGVKCILPDDGLLQRSESPHQINVKIQKFMRAVGSGPSYLFLERIDSAESTEDAATNSSGGTTSVTPTQTKERRQTDDSRSSDRTMLDKIAREKIGDEEFTVSKEDADSVVGQAKKRARSQGRDPAIDPAFQHTDDDDEEQDEDD